MISQASAKEEGIRFPWSEEAIASAKLCFQDDALRRMRQHAAHETFPFRSFPYDEDSMEAVSCIGRRPSPVSKKRFEHGSWRAFAEQEHYHFRGFAGFAFSSSHAEKRIRRPSFVEENGALTTKQLNKWSSLLSTYRQNTGG